MSFGGDSRTVETSSRPDPVVQEYGYQNLQIASDLASQPYIPFTGQRIQGFNPMEQASFDQVQGLTNLGAQGLGHGMARGLAQGLSASALGQTPAGYNAAVQGAMQGYQNPYEDAVLGGVERDLDRARQRQIRGIEDQLDASSFGGSRAAVAEDLANQSYMRQLTDASNQIRSQGFNTALGAAQQAASAAPQLQSQLAGQAFRGIGTMGNAAMGNLNRQLDIASAYQRAGQLQREMGQTGLNRSVIRTL